MDLPTVIAAVDDASDGLKAIALGVGAGLGTIGPGIGVGYIFGKVIDFYAFIFGLIAFFL